MSLQLTEAEMKEQAEKFQFFQKAELEVERRKIPIGFWELSKGSRVYGKSTGHGRPCYMCRRCGAIVGDYPQHARWHSMVEAVDISKVEVSTTY